MKYALNYRKILMSASVIAFVAALAFAGTQAFYSDEEASTGNVFAAGAIDLRIDNHAWYNGIECANVGTEQDPVYEWTDTNNNAQGDAYLTSLLGTECQSSWQLKDLESGDLFFNLTDLKPGDWEEDTISFHVDNNDAWLCANLKITEDDDVSSTEPELEAGDVEDVPEDNWDGELGGELNFIFWADDGDNVLEDDETVVLEGTPESLDGYGIDDNAGETFPLVDSTLNVWNGDGPLPAGDDPVYIGKAFCFGSFNIDPVAQDGEGDTNSPAINPGFSCDGASVTNMSQTDQLMGDLAFYAVQSRNNPDFQCSTDLFGGGAEEEGVGSVLAAYEAPAPEQCDLLVDGIGAGANEYETLQEAVDAAVAEDVICVDTGTYTENVTVDEDVTILGLNDPKGPDRATVDGRMDITVDGVTVTGLEITNPDAGYGIVINGVDNTELSFNSFVDIGSSLAGGSAQAIYFSDGVSDASGLSIHDNMIDNVGNTSLVADGSTSAKGIFVGDSDATSELSGLVIEDNMITNVFASTAEFSLGGRGAYGVLINLGDVTVSPVITRNTIETLEGLWVHAIGLEGDTPGASVTYNQIADLTEHKGGTDGFAVFFEANPGGSTSVVNYNNFEASMPFGVGIHSSSPVIAVDAENNWWGDADPSDDVDEGPGTIDYTPFQTPAFPQN